MKRKSEKNNLGFLWPYLIAGLLIIVVIIVSAVGANTKKIKFNDFDSLQVALNNAEMNGEVESLSVKEYETIIEISGRFKLGKTTYKFSAQLPIVDNGIGLSHVATKGEIYDYIYSFTDTNSNSIVKLEYAFGTSIWTTLLIYVLPSLLSIVIVFILISKIAGRGGNDRAFDFGKIQMKNATESKVRFSDVAGCDEEKAEMA